jgi:hypothetical protein
MERQAPAQAAMHALLAQLWEAKEHTATARSAPASADYDGHHPAVLLMLLLLCIGAAAGGFVMAWDPLTGSYHAISAPARALAVFAAELVFGHFAYVACRGSWLPCGVALRGRGAAVRVRGYRHHWHVGRGCRAPSKGRDLLCTSG